MITDSQAEEIKKQIFNQIESTFPNTQKELAKNQIKNMNNSELELFLKQNNLLVNSEKKIKKDISSCIFCSIFKNEVPSYKIDSNQEALAVLEINPISKGHIIIIPKNHISDSGDLPQKIFSLSKKLSKKIKLKLKPLDIVIYSSKIFDHIVLNLLPIYSNETQNSPRKKLSEDDFKKIYSLLSVKPKKKIETIKKTEKKKKFRKLKEKKINLPKKTENIWLPRRIP